LYDETSIILDRIDIILVIWGIDMIGTRYEEYEQLRNGLPFVLNADIERSFYNLSKENNWHENLEIQFYTKGSGTVLLDGKKFPVQEDTIVVVNSNVIHYTGTDKELVYDCLIVGTDFCKQMDFELRLFSFEAVIENAVIAGLLAELKKMYFDLSVSNRIAKLNKLLLQILIELAENHSMLKKDHTEKNKSYERTKLAIMYIRDNYQQRITLDEIARAAACDKYLLCKEFKKYTGQTVFENLNHYRCMKAIDYLTTGYTVAETASLCGFDNFSFFSRTFKKYIGKLPSVYKRVGTIR